MNKNFSILEKKNFDDNKRDILTILSILPFIGTISTYLLKHQRIDDLTDKIIKTNPTPEKLAKSLLKISEKLNGRKKKTVLRFIEELKEVEDENDYRAKVRKMIKSRMAGSLWIFLPGIGSIMKLGQIIKSQRDKGRTNAEIREMLYKFSDKNLDN